MSQEWSGEAGMEWRGRNGVERQAWSGEAGMDRTVETGPSLVDL